MILTFDNLIIYLFSETQNSLFIFIVLNVYFLFSNLISKGRGNFNDRFTNNKDYSWSSSEGFGE